jgi:hypothetical protein
MKQWKVDYGVLFQAGERQIGKALIGWAGWDCKREDD